MIRAQYDLPPYQDDIGVKPAVILRAYWLIRHQGAPEGTDHRVPLYRDQSVLA